jgi:hypothetical protein
MTGAIPDLALSAFPRCALGVAVEIEQSGIVMFFDDPAG